MTNSWIGQISNLLATSRRTAFVGVGQELRGDDAAGVLAVRALESAFASLPRGGGPEPAPFFFEAGPLPEASAGPLRRFRPDGVVFLDAADLGEPPGSVGWIEPDGIDDESAGTHAFPLQGFSRYLQNELGCRIALIGIQPRQMEFDSPASPEVVSAIDEIVRQIVSAATHL